MNSNLNTSVWIRRIVAVLGFIIIASGIIIIVLIAFGQPVLEIAPALGLVAVTGLIRLWISPLNREL